MRSELALNAFDIPLFQSCMYVKLISSLELMSFCSRSSLPTSTTIWTKSTYTSYEDSTDMYISPVLIGEVTMCWIVHEGGNVVSLSGLVILFFCYCCLVLSTTVNVNCRACCVQIRADLGHITLVIPRDWISLQLSSGEQAMMPMPDLVDQQYQRAYLSATRFVYLLTQWKASYATKISKLVCLASSSMPTPKPPPPPPPPDAPEALVMRIKMAPSWFLQRRVR